MRVTYWLIGCAFCLAGIGSAAAASVNTHDADSTTHATAAATVTNDGGASASSSGDMLGLNRETSTTSHDQGYTGSSSPNESDPSGGTSPAAPAPAHRPHLGWQSLLPGSIQ